MERTDVWVTVADAAGDVGASQSRLRDAYRRGRLAVRDDLVGGRRRKLVDLSEVRAWAGVADEAEPEAPPSPDVDAGELARRLDAALERADEALGHSKRAEQQVVFLRNEVAQLQDAHARVQAEVDRRRIEQFRDTARLACADALAARRRRRPVRMLLRRSSRTSREIAPDR